MTLLPAAHWSSTTTTCGRLVRAADSTWVTPDHLCPDLLRHSQLGPADGMRGRVVRGLFRLLDRWPVPDRKNGHSR